MRQTRKVVMLPTEKASSIGQYIDTGNLVLNNPKLDIVRGSFQHLYFLSNDEIKEGLCLALDSNIIFNCTKGDIHAMVRANGLHLHKNIIASTDKELTPSSWIPESFVQAYIKAYNEGKPITEVGLILEPLNILEENGTEFLPIVRPDGSVIIHQAKTYSHDEHIEGIKRMINLYATTYTDGNIDEWIENNL